MGSMKKMRSQPMDYEPEGCFGLVLCDERQHERSATFLGDFVQLSLCCELRRSVVLDSILRTPAQNITGTMELNFRM